MQSSDLPDIAKADVRDYLLIEGIGEKVANSLHQFFKDPQRIREINQLITLGIHWKSKSRFKYSKHIFTNKRFVLTGSLERYTRDQATQLIKERGGKVSSAVGKKIDYVLVGTSPGNKLRVAKELGIPILSEKEFEALL